MTVTGERPVLDAWEAEFSEEEEWGVASAQGTGYPHSVTCHRYPCRGSRMPACGAMLTYPMLLKSYHPAGPCPNGHPLCPECYP